MDIKKDWQMSIRSFCFCLLLISSTIRAQDLKNKFISKGLIDIHQVNKSILVDLRYSGKDNFLGLDLYGDLCDCYLQKEVAESLSKAEKALEEKYPYYRLLLLDCARPLSVQKMMWDTVKDIFAEKIKFLSNPDYGSLHNYGAAVDVTLADSHGNELDMGTAFDHKGELAYPEIEEVLYKQGKLTYRQVSNRKILREAMKAGGFFNIQTEWWHFNAMTRERANAKYEIIE